MSDTLSVWAEFTAALALIGFAGSALSRYGDMIATKTGMGGTWIGVILLATVTSFPELITGVSAVTLADEPDIAVGTVLGSCVFNMLVLVILDFLHRGKSVFESAGQEHIIAAGFGTVLMSVVGINIVLSGEDTGLWSFGFIGASTPMIVLLYAISVRVVFRHERSLLAQVQEEIVDDQEISLPGAIAGYTIASLVVIATSLWLPFVGGELSEVMGWERTFVGTLFIAVVTSIPEVVVTIAALRIGAVDMAVANLFGSNLFNILVVAIDDVFYVKGPILAHCSFVHSISTFSAIMMTGVAIVGLLYRPRGRVFGIVGWASLILVTIYLMNSFVLYLYGD